VAVSRTRLPYRGFLRIAYDTPPHHITGFSSRTCTPDAIVFAPHTSPQISCTKRRSTLDYICRPTFSPRNHAQTQTVLCMARLYRRRQVAPSSARQRASVICSGSTIGSWRDWLTDAAHDMCVRHTRSEIDRLLQLPIPGIAAPSPSPAASSASVPRAP
jgi:hypothetical protein